MNECKIDSEKVTEAISYTPLLSDRVKRSKTRMSLTSSNDVSIDVCHSSILDSKPSIFEHGRSLSVCSNPNYSARPTLLIVSVNVVADNRLRQRGRRGGDTWGGGSQLPMTSHPARGFSDGMWSVGMPLSAASNDRMSFIVQRSVVDAMQSHCSKNRPSTRRDVIRPPTAGKRSLEYDGIV